MHTFKYQMKMNELICKCIIDIVNENKYGELLNYHSFNMNR